MLRSPGVTRREFLRTTAAAAATAAAASCGRGALVERADVRGACMHDCPESCAWIVAVEDGEAVELRGDPAHPHSRGALCGKMDGYLTDVVYNPERLLYPLRRVGAKGEGRFERVGWDEALDDVAARLERIVAAHGGEAVLPYKFAGTMGLVQGWSLDERFFDRLGASRLGHTICGSTAGAGLSETLGTSTAMLPEDLAHSRLILMWGGNPVVTNPHGWRIVEEARAAGARVVSIDPLRSATAAAADRHVRPRPGTDAALALGMMHVLVRDGRHDQDYLARHTVGFDALRARLAEYPPERAATITGVPAEEIVSLAREYADARPAAIQVHVGMEKHHRGGAGYRAIACLPAIVGAWRERGGGLLYETGALFGAALNPDPLGAVGDGRERRSINMVRLGTALTDATLDPPVRALFVYDSNPATIAPDQNRVRRGLAREDLFTVVLEQFVTDTARYADYVFPATTQVEHVDLIVPYGTRYLSLNLPAIAPRGEARSNSEFFRLLARRLGFEDAALARSDEDIVRAALTSDHPWLAGITWDRLRRDGWAPLALPEDRLPFADGAFPTPSGKCELYSAAAAAEGRDPLPGHVEVERAADEVARHPLRFMSPKWNPYFVNSSHANQPRLERAAGRPRVRIHPDDAAARGIADGDEVRVFNDRGEIVVPAEVTDAMQPAVVAMLHGWWASRIGGSSANAVTSETLADLGGGSTLHDAWVQVERRA